MKCLLCIFILMTQFPLYTLVSLKKNEIISFIFLTVFMFLFFAVSVRRKMLCLFKEGKNKKKTRH